MGNFLWIRFWLMAERKGESPTVVGSGFTLESLKTDPALVIFLKLYV